MALIKCKECGSQLSSKAEVCPTCGLRLRAGPAAAKSGSGCIVGLFKLVGGLVGAVIGLMVAVSLLSNKTAMTPTSTQMAPTNTSVTPTRKLEIGCEEFVKTLPAGTDRTLEYESCIASGSSVIRAQQRINSEGGQTALKPAAEGNSSTMPSPVVTGTPKETVPPASDVPPAATSSASTPVQEVVTTGTPPQSAPEKTGSANSPVAQPDKGSTSQISTGSYASPNRQLEIYCEEGSKTQADAENRNAFYLSCISSGSAAIRARKRINQ